MKNSSVKLPWDATGATREPGIRETIAGGIILSFKLYAKKTRRKSLLRRMLPPQKIYTNKKKKL